MSAYVRRKLDRELVTTLVAFIATISLAAAIGASAVGTNFTILTAATEATISKS